MNPGYISLVLWCIMLILLASGWKDVLLRGISHGVILLFFAAWLGGAFCTISIKGSDISVNYIVIFIAAMVVLLSRKSMIVQAQLISIALLLGSLKMVLGLLNEHDPIMLIYFPQWEQTLIIALCVGLLVKLAIEQFAVLSLGYMMSFGTEQLIASDGGNVWFGSPGFYDEWWISFICIRGITLLWEWGAVTVKVVASQMELKWKGRRR